MCCKGLGVQKGDRVSLYMPMVPEAVIAMLACARLGAPHSVVFGGFSSEALRERTLDCGSKIIITADGYWRRGSVVPLKQTTDEAVEGCPDVRNGDRACAASARTGEHHDAGRARCVVA